MTEWTVKLHFPEQRVLCPDCGANVTLSEALGPCPNLRPTLAELTSWGWFSPEAG